MRKEEEKALNKSGRCPQTRWEHSEPGPRGPPSLHLCNSCVYPNKSAPKSPDFERLLRPWNINKMPSSLLSHQVPERGTRCLCPASWSALAVVPGSGSARRSVSVDRRRSAPVAVRSSSSSSGRGGISRAAGVSGEGLPELSHAASALTPSVSETHNLCRGRGAKGGGVRVVRILQRAQKQNAHTFLPVMRNHRSAAACGRTVPD